MGTSIAILALSIVGPLNLQPLLDQLATDQDAPGVSAVVTHRDEVVFSGGSGVSDIETGAEMSADTVLYAGSLTKILTAILTLQLVDEGKLSLDDTVDGISIIQRPEITIAQLLTHSSGLVREGDFGYWFSGAFPDSHELRRFLEQTELRGPPGERVRYSNIGFAKLGLVVEATTNQTYHDALRARVLQPLGMESTGSPGPMEEIGRGYTPTGRIIPSAERPFAGVGAAVGERHLREYHDAGAMSPAFGAYTTANDLARVVQFLLGHGGQNLLSDELRRDLLTPQNSTRSFGLGTGTFRDRPVARHGGWFAAHKSHILIDLESETGVVVIANSDSADADAIAKALLGAVLDTDQQ